MKEGKRSASESSGEWASLGAEAASFLWSCEWPGGFNSGQNCPTA
jgi:hypothetical protein